MDVADSVAILCAATATDSVNKERAQVAKVVRRRGRWTVTASKHQIPLS